MPEGFVYRCVGWEVTSLLFLGQRWVVGGLVSPQWDQEELGSVLFPRLS